MNKIIFFCKLENLSLRKEEFCLSLEWLVILDIRPNDAYV